MADDWNRTGHELLHTLKQGEQAAGGESSLTVSLEVLGDLSDESLERKLSDQELRGPTRQLDLDEAHGGTHFWYRLISRRATVPGLYLCGFLTPPETCCWGADFRAALVATVVRMHGA